MENEPFCWSVRAAALTHSGARVAAGTGILLMVFWLSLLFARSQQ